MKHSYAIGDRRGRWPWIVVAICGVLAVLTTLVLAGRGATGPARTVDATVAALEQQPGVTLRGSVEDDRGARTAVTMTVAADGLARATLTRDFGASAELIGNGTRTVLRGNVQWWRWSNPESDIQLADRWVSDPPPRATGFVDPAAFTPRALAAALRSEAGHWSEIGERPVGGRQGTELFDGKRFVVAPTGADGPPLQMGIPLAPSVVPRALVTGPEQTGPEPDPAGADANFSEVGEPGARDLENLRAEVAPEVAGAGTTPVPPPPDPATPAPDAAHVLDRLTADDQPVTDQAAGKENNQPLTRDQAQKIVDTAIRWGEMPALYRLVDSGLLTRRAALIRFMNNLDKQAQTRVTWRRHLQAAARETEGRFVDGRIVKPLAIGLDTAHDGADADVVLVYDPATGLRPVVMQIKTVSGSLDALEKALTQGSNQLRGGTTGAKSPEGWDRELHLVFEADAVRGLGVANRDEILDILRDLDVYRLLLDVPGGTPAPDRVLVTNRPSADGPEVTHVFPVEDLDPDREPGPAVPSGVPGPPGWRPGPTGPRPVVPQAGGGAAAAPTPEDEEDEENADQPLGNLLSEPGSTKASQGPLIDTVSEPPKPGDPGGIDFGSLSLRYLSDGSTGAPTRYAFSANPGAAGSTAQGSASLHRGSDAFFVWLSLPPSSFWVNLNPNEPDRITDPKLGTTDVGRILLEADLDLKRSLARLTEPNTPAGARFWASPGAEDFLRYCGTTRAWIVPGPADVREEGDAVFVENAPLVVRTERADVGAAAGPCTPPPPDAAARQDALVRSVALPEMQRQVDEDPRYAALRQVYYARVAAEWYRQRSATRHTEFANLVDDGDVTPWALRSAWTPRQVFDRYRQSFTAGEYPMQDVTVAGRNWSVTEGGIDLTDVPLRTDPRPAPPELTQGVARSFDEPTRDPGGLIWLGSVTDVPAPGPPWGLIGAGAAVVLAALAGGGYGWRRRNRGRPVGFEPARLRSPFDGGSRSTRFPPG